MAREILVVGEERYNLVTSETAEEAIRLLRTSRPVLVVLDALLPPDQAVQVLSSLRADPQLQEVEVVTLPARTPPQAPRWHD